MIASALLETLAGDPLLLLLAQLAVFGSLTAGAVLLLLSRCRAPTLRHAVARTGLLALVLLPLTLTLAHGAGTGLFLLPAAAGPAWLPPPIEKSPAPVPQQQDVPTFAPSATPRMPAAVVPSATLPVAAPASPAAGLCLLLAWSALSLALLLRELRRWRRLRAAIRGAAPIDDPRWIAHIARLAAALRLPSPPRLVALDALPCPATFGLFRPTLLLPQRLLAHREGAATNAILRHELAHLALGHHREGALQLLARSLFAWLPWAHALARELGQAQEQLADNVAIQGDGGPLAYARTLLALAEAATSAPPPAPLLLSSLGHHQLRDRITRLLSGEPDMNYRPSRQSRIASATVFALTVAAPFPFCLLPGQAPRQSEVAQTLVQDPSPAAAPGPNSGAHFLPLAEGTTWTWHVTRKDGDQHSERDETSRVWGMVPARDGTLVAQVQTSRGGHVSWEYRAAREDGVFSYHNAYLGGLRGVGRIDERLLPAPVGATTQWEWDQQLSFQTMGNAPQPDPETTRVHHLAKLVAVDETVTVPAGTYKAAHVQIQATGAHQYSRDLWFARGVGLVKDEHAGANTHQVRELTAFAKGTPAALDAKAALQAWRATTPAFADAACEWVPVGEEACYVRGRFAILRPGDRAVCAHVTSSGVITFAPDNKAYWTAQLAALAADREPADAPAGQRQARPSDDMQVTYLAGAAARLAALAQRCTQLQAAGSRTEQQLGGQPSSTCTTSFRATDADGKPVLVTAQMQVEGDAVTGMKLETTPDEGRRK